MFAAFQEISDTFIPQLFYNGVDAYTHAANLEWPTDQEFENAKSSMDAVEIYLDGVLKKTYHAQASEGHMLLMIDEYETPGKIVTEPPQWYIDYWSKRHAK